MSFLFYDFETTGIDPRLDRPMQFAAVRTDDQFNELGEPLVLYARLAPDRLPHPMAVLVTGILPDRLAEAGAEPEAVFARRIKAEMAVPGTCAVGFNSMRFDAELMRFMFWRNLLDPYSHEWRDGNSRWDVLDVARAMRVLRPGSIAWPNDEAGNPSLRLEALTAANGIEHGQAHDALADVRATLALARLMQAEEPKLFDYLLNLRDKRQVARLVDGAGSKGFVHVSGRIPTTLGNASLFASLGVPAGINNQRLLWDLRHDPAQLLDESIEQLQARVYLSQADQTDEVTRLPVKKLHINRAPVVVPASILNEDAVAQRMQIERTELVRHQATLKAHYEQLCQRLATVMEPSGDFPAQSAEAALYEGFVANGDRAALDDSLQQLDSAPAKALMRLRTHAWGDQRLPPLIERYIARNWPDRLDDAQRENWLDYLRQRLLQPSSDSGLDYAAFFEEIDRLQSLPDRSAQQRQLLDALRAWGARQQQALHAGVLV